MQYNESDRQTYAYVETRKQLHFLVCPRCMNSFQLHFHDESTARYRNNDSMVCPKCNTCSPIKYDGQSDDEFDDGTDFVIVRTGETSAICETYDPITSSYSTRSLTGEEYLRLDKILRLRESKKMSDNHT